MSLHSDIHIVMLTMRYCIRLTQVLCNDVLLLRFLLYDSWMHVHYIYIYESNLKCTLHGDHCLLNISTMLIEVHPLRKWTFYQSRIPGHVQSQHCFFGRKYLCK